MENSEDLNGTLLYIEFQHTHLFKICTISSSPRHIYIITMLWRFKTINKKFGTKILMFTQLIYRVSNWSVEANNSNNWNMIWIKLKNKLHFFQKLVIWKLFYKNNQKLKMLIFECDWNKFSAFCTFPILLSNLTQMNKGS